MPAFKGKLKNNEIISLVAYFHTLALVANPAVSEVRESTYNKIQKSSTPAETIQKTPSPAGEGEKIE